MSLISTLTLITVSPPYFTTLVLPMFWQHHQISHHYHSHQDTWYPYQLCHSFFLDHHWVEVVVNVMMLAPPELEGIRLWPWAHGIVWTFTNVIKESVDAVILVISAKCILMDDYLGTIDNKIPSLLIFLLECRDIMGVLVIARRKTLSGD